ncbi:MAG: FAD-binding oxidoreductase [Thermostichus sp. DRC_bins_24]
MVAPNSAPLIAWEQVFSELAGIEVLRGPEQTERFTRVEHTYSPILNRVLQGKGADGVVRPKTEAEVLQVAQVCVRHRIPLTLRGSGSANQGQWIPLRRGLVLDTSALTKIVSVQPGSARAQAGVKLATLEKRARAIGWEMRILPSTFRTATLGGHLSGGSGGAGSTTYGLQFERGHLLAARLVTLQEPPQVLELQGSDLQKVAHSWGINGILTELQVALAPAQPWSEGIVCFQDFMTAARFCNELGNCDGIPTRLISLHAWPIPTYFAALKSYIPIGHHAVLVLVSDHTWDPFLGLVQDYGGELCYHKPSESSGKGLTLIEYSFNHTTLHATTADPSLTYLSAIFDPELHNLERLYRQFPEEVMIHIEFRRIHGRLMPAGVPLVRFTTPERLKEIAAAFEAEGAVGANVHAFVYEEVGRKAMEPQQLQFKQLVDPYGLMNPGKVRALQTAGRR